ncbi:MAG TPA: TMEM175 family protein [Candidatus Acidoferrum sp.]|nr:TMEM175 family protein [Candidatus Acidoferrum sp.]
MSHNKEKQLEADIKREFQLERMILFSDAVFAIVITLMAIEIRLPDSAGTSLTMDEFMTGLTRLYPVLLAYLISFSFIGVIWSHHLRIFSLLKDYDKGLVSRNLALLFFVGLFPFGATVISKGPKGVLLPLLIYLSIIVCCLGALAFIEQYIYYTKPALRNDTDIGPFLEKFRLRKAMLATLGAVIVLVIATERLVTDPQYAWLPFLWLILLPLAMAVFGRKKK